MGFGSNGAGTRGARLRNMSSCSSMLVIATLWAGTANAQCVPNPAQTGTATTCSGTTSGGYTITTNSSPLTVVAGASIQNDSGDALTVSIPHSAPYTQNSASITVNGAVTSTSGNGITILSGATYPGYPDYYGTTASITVGAGASVSGTTGISLASSPNSYYYYYYGSPVYVSLDNYGTIGGTNGLALGLGNGPTSYSLNFTSITNEATGSMGAIAAPFSQLTNIGVISGGIQSAISTTSYGGGSIVNSGVIQANG